MNDRASRNGLPPSVLAELDEFLARSGNPLTLEQAASHAIQQWIKAQQQTASAGQGYQWKCRVPKHRRQDDEMVDYCKMD